MKTQIYHRVGSDGDWVQLDIQRGLHREAPLERWERGLLSGVCAILAGLAVAGLIVLTGGAV